MIRSRKLIARDASARPPTTFTAVTEAGAGLAAYEPDAALTYETSLELSRQVGNHWLVFTSVTYEAFDDEISQSPMVDQNYQLSAFAGVTYHFGKRPTDE